MCIVPGVDLGEGCTGVCTPVGLGQQGCKGVQKISITIISVNARHYKYSILKRKIKRLLNTNQKYSNINKEIVYIILKATLRGLSLKNSVFTKIKQVVPEDRSLASLCLLLLTIILF